MLTHRNGVARPTFPPARRRLLLLSVAAVVGSLAAGFACAAVESRPGEVPTWLRPGAPLRLRIDGPGESKSVTGRYLGHGDSTLSVSAGHSESTVRSVDITIDRIVRFEVSQERSSHAWKGLWVGWLVIGAASTAVMFASDEFNETEERAGAVLIGAAFYGPLGGMLGSLAGSSVPKERWVVIWDRVPGGGP